MDAPLDGEEFRRWRQQADSAAQTAGLARAGGRAEWAWPGDLDDAAARLSRHYIATRYPDAVPSGPNSAHYADSDAAQAEQDARALVGAVDETWGVLGAA